MRGPPPIQNKSPNRANGQGLKKTQITYEANHVYTEYGPFF